MHTQIQILRIHHPDYAYLWNLQHKLLDYIIEIKRKNRDASSLTPVPNYLILTEHSHVITLGKSGKASHLLLPDKELQRRGISFHKINRGGDITYHGPGQLVVYPILDLEQFGTDINRYISTLENVVIDTLTNYQVEATPSPLRSERGVWIDAHSPLARKICAIGVRLSRWVSMHGLALNVSTDLSYYDYIVPCGIRDKEVTSLQKEIGREVELSEVEKLILSEFKQHLNAEMKEITYDELPPEVKGG